MAIEIKPWSEGRPDTYEVTVCMNYRTTWDYYGGGEDWDEVDIDYFQFRRYVLRGFANHKCPCCDGSQTPMWAEDTLYADLTNDGHAVGRSANYGTWSDNTAIVVGICHLTGKQFVLATHETLYDDDYVQELVTNAWEENRAVAYGEYLAERAEERYRY